MKFFILCIFAAASQAQAVLLNHGLIGTGASSQFNHRDGLGNYAFGYNEGHATGGTFRRESGGHGAVTGSYGLTDADGRHRVVNYVADGLGFRADIKTNEPGVEPKDPAAARINKAGIIAAPVLHAAPAFQYAAAVPAPAHYGGAFAYNTAIGHRGLGYGHGFGYGQGLGYGLGYGHHGFY